MNFDSLSVPVGEDYPEVREGVRKVCEPFDGAYWQKLEEDDSYPTDFVNALTESGFLAVLIPEEYGGSGLPLRAASVILEEIHAMGCNAGACHAQMYIMGTLLRHGNEEQKQKYLPKIANGDLRLQAFGVTEPTSGSDTTKLQTKAEKVGNEYLVNGQKVWTSRALHSDLMLLLARTTPLSEVKNKTDGLSVFLVDMKESLNKGLEIQPIKAMVNHNTTEVFFNDLRVPEGNLIGKEGEGFKYIMDGMNAERILVGSECIGDAKWFIKTAVDYANARVVFNTPIGKNQGIQFPISRAYAEMQAAELMIRRACALFDAGEKCGQDANMGKLLASESSWHAGEACLQTHGGFGVAREYNVERKWRENRLYQIAPVSSNLILAYIGQHILGMPRSY